MNPKKWILLLLVLNLLLPFVFFLIKTSFQPIAIVVPHHNLVKEKRLEFLKSIAQERKETKTIVIISPDHFSPNQHSITYTDKTWHLSNGEIEFDYQLGNKLTQDLSKETGVLEEDHGIYNLLPDIKNVWSKAKVVPIIIGMQVEFNQLNNLLANLNTFCKKDCLLIASVDFSHYLPRSLADIHDLNNYEALNNLDVKENGKIEVDSPQSLYLLTEFAKNKGAKNFNLFAHTNSGWLANNRDIETTTHFFGWYQKDLLKTETKSFETFLVATNLNQKEKVKALGERFYYGVDYYNGQLDVVYQPDEKIKIIPIEKMSAIEQKKGILNILLGPDLVVSGYQTDKSSGLIFLPIKKVEKENFLLRGEEKSRYFEQLFNNFPENKIFKLDKEEGTILY